MNNKTYLELNISSYCPNQLSSTDILTWHTTNEPINQKFKNIGINKNHIRTEERKWRMVNECIEKGVQYTGKKFKHTGITYLVKD